MLRSWEIRRIEWSTGEIWERQQESDIAWQSQIIEVKFDATIAVRDFNECAVQLGEDFQEQSGLQSGVDFRTCIQAKEKSVLFAFAAKESAIFLLAGVTVLPREVKEHVVNTFSRLYLQMRCTQNRLSVIAQTSAEYTSAARWLGRHCNVLEWEKLQWVACSSGCGLQLNCQCHRGTQKEFLQQMPRRVLVGCGEAVQANGLEWHQTNRALDDWSSPRCCVALKFLQTS